MARLHYFHNFSFIPIYSSRSLTFSISPLFVVLLFIFVALQFSQLSLVQQGYTFATLGSETGWADSYKLCRRVPASPASLIFFQLELSEMGTRRTFSAFRRCDMACAQVWQLGSCRECSRSSKLSNYPYPVRSQLFFLDFSRDFYSSRSNSPPTAQKVSQGSWPGGWFLCASLLKVRRWWG